MWILMLGSTPRFQLVSDKAIWVQALWVLSLYCQPWYGAGVNWEFLFYFWCFRCVCSLSLVSQRLSALLSSLTDFLFLCFSGWEWTYTCLIQKMRIKESAKWTLTEIQWRQVTCHLATELGWDSSLYFSLLIMKALLAEYTYTVISIEYSTV